jgi:hypothetical protein
MWSSTLQKYHINLLEMRAVLLALSHFKLCLESLSIVLTTDNKTVVAYLKNQGGTHCCTLYQLAKDVLILCSQFQIRLVVRHIRGRLNILADSLSRSLAPVNTEWELHQAVFQSIVLHWGNPNIDLFATSLNLKVTTFVSPVPDPRAYAVDAMRRFRFKGSASGLAQDRRSRFANQACFGQAGAITMILHFSPVIL